MDISGLKAHVILMQTLGLEEASVADRFGGRLTLFYKSLPAHLAGD